MKHLSNCDASHSVLAKECTCGASSKRAEAEVIADRVARIDREMNEDLLHWAYSWCQDDALFERYEKLGEERDRLAARHATLSMQPSVAENGRAKV